MEQAIEAQISFAVQHDNVDQVFIPAEPHYFKLFVDLKRETMKRKLLDRETTGLISRCRHRSNAPRP